MAMYDIVSGSGFAGNAQRCDGTQYEGILLNNITTGSKYMVSMAYRSSVPIAIYSMSGSESVLPANGSYIPANTGSAMNWSGEFLSVNSDNFIGLSGSGWFEIDKLRVKNIPNLVTNGTFNTDLSEWVIQSGNVTWYSGSMKFLSVGGAISQITQVKYYLRPYGKYKVSFQTVESTLTGNTFRFRGNTTDRLSPIDYYVDDGGTPIRSVGIHTITLANSMATGIFNVLADFVLNTGTPDGQYIVIDNIHIQEIPEYTSLGNHTASVSLTDKYLGSCSLMISASGAGRGSELVTNGGFDSDTAWTKEAGWTISSGSAKISNSSGTKYLSQPVALNSTKTYEVTWNIISVTGSLYRPSNGAGGNLVAVSSPGIYRYTFTGQTGATLYIGASNGSSGEIDNVSVKEVLGEVSLPSNQIQTLVSGNKYTLEGWAKVDPTSLSYGSNVIASGTFANWTGDNPNGWLIFGEDVNSYVTQHVSGARWVTAPGSTLEMHQNSLINNRLYKINITVSDYVTGSLVIRFTGVSDIGTINGNGTFTFYGKSDGNQFRFVRVPLAADMVINSVTVQEATAIPTIATQIGTKSVTSTTLSPTSWTKSILNFEASTSEINQDIKLYTNSASVVYVDNISLTQAYDCGIILNKKHSSSLVDADYALSTGAGGGGAGYVIYSAASSGNTIVSVSDSISNIRSSTIPTLTGSFVKIVGYIDRVNNNSIYQNDIMGSSISISSSLGKVINYKTLHIGSFAGGGSDSFSGSIGPVQILRFSNISSSNFNPTTYKIGQRLLGGGNEVVFHFDPSRDGTSINTVLQDWSGNNNHLSASNMDITNRVVTR